MTYDKDKKDASEHGCYPYEQIKAARDNIHSGKEPETPHYTSTEKLMKPQDGEEVEG